MNSEKITALCERLSREDEIILWLVSFVSSSGKREFA